MILMLNIELCYHSRDKCGCYAALQEEKSMLEYRLGKFHEKQQNFLENIRQTIVEATTLSRDTKLILELTKLGNSQDLNFKCII